MVSCHLQFSIVEEVVAAEAVVGASKFTTCSVLLTAIVGCSEIELRGSRSRD